MTSEKDKSEDPNTVPVIEERAAISKKEKVTGGKKVSTTIETVEEEAALALASQKATLDRVPVNEVVETRPEPRLEDGVVIIPITEERLVVTKQLVVTEEIRVRIDETRREERRTVPLSKERVRIDDIPSADEDEDPLPSRPDGEREDELSKRQ